MYPAQVMRPLAMGEMDSVIIPVKYCGEPE